MGRQGSGGRWAAVAWVVGGLVLAPAAVAEADEVVVCNGGAAHVARIEHTRVEGDLQVRRGTTCYLDHVVVTGRLLVPPAVPSWEHTEARLTASEVRGASEVGGRTSELTADRSTLHDVALDGAEKLHLGRTTVRGDVRGTVRVVEAGNATVTGDAAVRGTDSQLSWAVFSGVEVGGDLAASAMQTIVERSVVSGDARIVSPIADRRPRPGAYAAWVCSSEVAGELRVARAHDKVAIGAHPDGADEWSCPGEPGGANTFGTLTLVDNPHSIAVGNTLVRGDLRCYGNSGPRGVDASGATVEGTRRGQCA